MYCIFSQSYVANDRVIACLCQEETPASMNSAISRLCHTLLHHAGVISSNGVNGSQATESDSGTGIQVLHGLPSLNLTETSCANCHEV